MQTIKKLLSQLFLLFSLVAAINAVMVIAYPLGQINDWPRFLLTEGALNSQEEWEDFTSNCLDSYWQVEVKIFILAVRRFSGIQHFIMYFLDMNLKNTQA